MMLDRRRFQISAIYGLWSAMGAVFSVPALRYLFTPPRSASGAPRWIDAGDISRLPLNEPEEVVFRRNRVDGWKLVSEKSTAWVIRKSENDVVAFSPQCTHLGCAYHYAERSKEFLCPCHTSTFALDGNVLTGPAPRPLDRYEVKLEGNKLLLGQVRRSEQA
jgi:menaquinol-cytochrome c reductase iron-sulfur subunit